VNAAATEVQEAAPDPWDDYGYRGTVACTAAGITYRQLDYWARTDLVTPTMSGGIGFSGARLYSFRDIIVLKIVKRLLDTGVSLHNIRCAVGHVRSRTSSHLAGITLMSDGATVYECTSAEEVVDLVHAGHGVFGISVAAVWREIEAALARLPAEQVGHRPADAPPPGPQPIDELALRRRSRQAG
jgi:DNA-binding transcriptional MerR regulator